MYKIDDTFQVMDVVEIEFGPNGDKYPNLELSRPKHRMGKTYKMNSSRLWVVENGQKKNLIDHAEELSVQLIFCVIIGGIFAWLSIAVAKEKRDTNKKEL